MELKALGKTTEYCYNKPDATLLERFPNPMTVGKINTIEIVAPEFTSLCPITGQPDFATIVITYMPDEWCVESKSIKLYFGSFRMYGEFHEACVNRILSDLVELINPYEITVIGQFAPRGGIKFWPEAFWCK